ncbi:Smg-4/UPF3 family-domain-containing protein [Pholiota molesta]|nr:Smg-4/UPF3 family-domain-containing protein [Pholiota molesta]
MSTAHTPTKAQKSRKEKDKDKENERKASLPQQNERLKTVVRRLPPNLPEDIFWQSVQPWVTEESALWKLYCPGKLRKKLNKENVPSRAYIAFKDEEKLALFSREYDGHVFRDKSDAGVESHAVVEFAPYPKIPSEKRKPDPRNATIEKDEDYISFLETLKAAENPEPVTLESLIAASQPAPPPKTTPLLEALKAEKSANKDKEAILRNHAHYNSMTVTSLRKEEKKKAAAAAAPPAKPEPSVPLQTTARRHRRRHRLKHLCLKLQRLLSRQHLLQLPKAVLTPGQSSRCCCCCCNEATKPPTILAPPSTETAVATAPAAAAAPAPAAATTRRTRPVIGLANRQFEAALSGVSGLANAATERKKREKEREAQAVAGGGSVPPTPAATATATTTFARIDGSDTESRPLLLLRRRRKPDAVVVEEEEAVAALPLLVELLRRMRLQVAMHREALQAEEQPVGAEGEDGAEAVAVAVPQMPQRRWLDTHPFCNVNNIVISKGF